MRIGIDAHVFDEKFQGSRTYLEGIYKEAIRLRENWEFYFFAKDVNQLMTVFGNWDHVKYIPLTSNNKYTRLLLEFPRLLKKHRIDYAHFQYIAPLNVPCKYFVTTHDILFLEPRFKKYFPWKYRFLNSILFKRSARHSNFVLTVSDYSKQKIQEHFNLTPSKVYVTTNAVSLPNLEIKENYIHKEYKIAKYILYVSRVEPRKNHLALLRAFMNLNLADKGYMLVFIGSKDLPYPELDAYVAKHEEKLKNTFFQFPGISGEALQHFYSQAEVFVYPSLAEGFGIPPLEAAMHETPVVCSNATAMSDFSFFRHHINPNDQSALEKAIMDALQGNVENLDSLKLDIQRRYSWKESAEVLIQAVEEDAIS